MARPATIRLKCNPPLGRMPVMSFMLPSELRVDPTYQRSLENGNSQALIRRMAQHWNWDLCQPLVVARRAGGGLFVIDGQHRLEAARLRGDIGQLPCVVVEYANAKDEAASFVHLNQQRRPLTKIDLFKAAVASDDPEATAIVAAIESAGLSIAPHSNFTAWKAGMVANIGGIENAWRQLGPKITAAALRAMGQAYPGVVLQYAGTIFPGIAAVCADEMPGGRAIGPERFTALVAMVSRTTQAEWRRQTARIKADDPNLNFAKASAAVFRAAWDKHFEAASSEASPALKTVSIPVPPDGKRWCDQCDDRVALSAAAGCKSRYCTLRRQLERAR